MEENAEVEAGEEYREEDPAEDEEVARDDLEGSVTVQEDAHLGVVGARDDILCKNNIV